MGFAEILLLVVLGAGVISAGVSLMSFYLPSGTSSNSTSNTDTNDQHHSRSSTPPPSNPIDMRPVKPAISSENPKSSSSFSHVIDENNTPSKRSSSSL